MPLFVAGFPSTPRTVRTAYETYGHDSESANVHRSPALLRHIAQGGLILLSPLPDFRRAAQPRKSGKMRIPSDWRRITSARSFYIPTCETRTCPFTFGAGLLLHTNGGGCLMSFHAVGSVLVCFHTVRTWPDLRLLCVRFYASLFTR